jgi:hypothetical protein
VKDSCTVHSCSLHGSKHQTRESVRPTVTADCCRMSTNAHMVDRVSLANGSAD